MIKSSAVPFRLPATLPVVLLIALSAVSTAPADAADRARRGDAVDAAIKRGIQYLLEVQDRRAQDGAINDANYNNTAMTALAMMSMAAVGHQPTDRTTIGRGMRRALEFVLQPERQFKGYYFGGDGSRMYGHGITTLALSELQGMGVDKRQDRRLRKAVRQGVRLILASQNVEKRDRDRGGWRYSPSAGDSDLSVSVWQVMALRSARNAGVRVPKEAIDAALDYLARCYDGGRGGFGYQPGSRSTYAMTSAGLLSMQVCGRYDADEVRGAADWLIDDELNFHDHWFFYGTYYYAQGMYQRGGEYARRARSRVEKVLLQRQARDGSWTASSGKERHAGRVYATSMAILSLSVKHHYLPIYQR